ncbi:MAG TPA: HAD-IA family hydrolase [Steroidobacteraceae bacterium]|jgi:HAD superfamily hydrolase (TIGR01509 family)
MKTRNHISLAALILDVDGTLADTEETHRRAFNAAFHAHSLDWVWSADLYADLLQVTGGKERIGHYIDRLDIGPTARARLTDLIPLIHRTKTSMYAELVRLGSMRPRPGIRRLIEEARAAHVAVAIASTTSSANIDALLTASFGPDSLRWFSVVATGDIVARKKPAPDIYCTALDSLGVSPQQAVAIEDSQIGVEAAKAAGLVTIATPTRWTAAQDFTTADLVLDSLGDPADPLDEQDERRIGARYFGLRQLAALHTSRHPHTRATS